MTTWKLLYENHFPKKADGSGTVMDMYRSANGNQTTRWGFSYMPFTSLPGLNIGYGKNLVYRPNVQLRNVIGLDISMELVVISLSEDYSVPLCKIDVGGLSASLAASSSGQNTYRLTLNLGDFTTTVDGLRLRSQKKHRLQIRWCTNGQLNLWFDGLLVAYENSVKPGYRFNLSQLTIGDRPPSDGPLIAGGVVNVTIHDYRVVELREESAQEVLGEQLSPEKNFKVSKRCEIAAVAGLEQLMRDARNLMAGFNGNQTSSWRKGDSSKPFAPIALVAHKAGTKAGLAFARYLREGTLSARQEVSLHLNELLKTLAADQPALFKTLVEKSKQARDQLEVDCKRASEEVRNRNHYLFKKLEPLSSDLGALIQSLGGGGGN